MARKRDAAAVRCATVLARDDGGCAGGVLAVSGLGQSVAGGLGARSAQHTAGDAHEGGDGRTAVVAHAAPASPRAAGLAGLGLRAADSVADLLRHRLPHETGPEAGQAVV